MLLNKYLKGLILTIVLFTSFACSYDGPDEIFDPNNTGNETPIITSIEPADLALAQYTEVKIIGKNFASGADSTLKNLVYFNNEKGTIISESETEIIVIPPHISGENIKIKIVVPGAVKFAEFDNYRVEFISTKSESFLPIEIVQAIAMDANENLYAAIRSGNAINFYLVEPGKDKYEYASAKVPIVEDMKIGPNNALYFVPGNRDLYVIPPGGGSASVFVKLPKNVKYFDFDENKNIYIGGSKTGMYKVSSDLVVTDLGNNFANFDIKSIRIFNGYVYYSANYSGTESFPTNGVWKSQINETNGNLSNSELVFDWTLGINSTAKIGTITLAVDGTLFIGSDSDENPILLVNPDGSSNPLYSGLLYPKTVQFIWGNSTTLYHNVVNNDEEIQGIYKVFISDWQSAPYYGRL